MVSFMKQHKEILIGQCFEKADEALLSAKINIDNNLLSTAQNRIYYAIFYSVLALGYKRGFVTSKHGQLLGWFNKICVNEEKLFNQESFAIYKEAYDKRTRCDYHFDWKPKREESIRLLKLAGNFVEKVKEYLSNLDV